MPTPLQLMRRIYKLDGELEQRVADMMEQLEFRRGDVINAQSALHSQAFYILTGSARVYYLKGGKEKTFSFSFEDEYIMLSRHLIESGDTTLSIEFLEPTTVITLRPEKVRDVMQNESAPINMSEAMLFINMALMKVNLYLEERLAQFQQASARERYLWAINRYPRLLEVATGTQLASFLGITRETLYRLRGDSYPS